MKVALVFFYSDNTLLIAKQSQCVLRSSFEQGQEAEVKFGKCPYVALILRTAGKPMQLIVFELDVISTFFSIFMFIRFFKSTSDNVLYSKKVHMLSTS